MKYDFALKRHPGPCELRWFRVSADTWVEANKKANNEADKARSAVYAGPLEVKEATT